MTDKDEKILKGFFADHKQSLRDDGFSEKVMSHVPACEMKLVRLWTTSCTLLGVVLFIVFRGWTLVYSIGDILIDSISRANWLHTNPLMLLIAAIVSMIIMVGRVCSIE